jgi:hypothetical protein
MLALVSHRLDIRLEFWLHYFLSSQNIGGTSNGSHTEPLKPIANFRYGSFW